jgi:asparagine synthase (glutamine-hydrolysing)
LTAYGGSFEEAAHELASAVAASVSEAVEGRSKVAVAFSGGVDSAVIAVCAKRSAKVLACTAYAEGALDGARAAEAAAAMGLEPVATRVTPAMVEAELEAFRLPFDATLMDRSLWCLYSMVARSAAQAGGEVVLLGQLADELFGGYSKYQRALEEEGPGAAEALMLSDVEGYWSRGKVRDTSACARWLPAAFPFESKGVTGLGARIPVEFKIRDGVRKAVLRRAAVLLGVPPEVAGAPKKAAQFSSGIQKLVR